MRHTAGRPTFDDKAPGYRVLDAEGLNGGPPPEQAGLEAVTPVSRFFTRNHAPIPAVDPASWRLRVRGLVREPLALSLADLGRRFDRHRVPATLVCAGLRREELARVRPIPGELVWGLEPAGTAVWGGVALRDVLLAAGVLDAAAHVGLTGLDAVERHERRYGFGGSIPMAKAMPAGSSIFANNQLGISLSNNNYKNDSNYYGKNTSDNDNTFDLNQIGAVFTFENNRKKSNWKKLGLAINYENIKSLDNSLNIAGTNPTNSVDNYFLYYADGLPLSTLDGSNYNYDELFFNEQQAYLAYQSYLIDPTANTQTNNTYYTNISNAGNYYQEKVLSSKGYNGKVNINIFQDNLQTNGILD